MQFAIPTQTQEMLSYYAAPYSSRAPPQTSHSFLPDSASLSPSALSHSSPLLPDTHETLDALASPFEARITNDPLSQVLHANTDILGRSIEDILLLMDERRQISNALIQRTENDITEHRSTLADLESRTMPTDPIRGNIGKQIASIVKDQDAERVACWRDLARLRAELREAAGEFRKARAREAMLEEAPR